ncbi:MAG TPA: adenylosuccinate synthase [Cytophagales bacterium]|nr:adenylosuccinate synthase [Cytophagales bacterium]HAP64267.1 adenylosuccinate synthase [Cytophagales bacterium]
MKVDVLLGLQWGDEGKGKIVDFLAPKYNVVARFQGGPNAGHTLEFDGHKHVLHQIPSGIFRKNICNVVGNGVVLDPIIFKEEIDKLSPFQVDVSKNLFVSKKAQLILPTHRLLDAADEQAKGAKKIGSTLKGIGPTYRDKTSRNGLRVGDILSPNFKEKYDALVSRHKVQLSAYDFEYDLQSMEEEWFGAIEFMKALTLVESEHYINQQISSSSSILAEGAQGSLLDIDFGSYPFVTSSTTMAAGVCTGLGVAPSSIGEVFGIFKAYCTRVGSGPFPTELHDEVGEELRREGKEFGATTGRPRRCGWLDLPALRYAIMLNGVTQLFMMKADVLNIFKEIQICTEYKLEDGSVTRDFPYEANEGTVEPIYRAMKGWDCSLESVEDLESIPEALKEYVAFIEKEVGVPINIVSVGPDRLQTLVKGELIA